MSISIWIAILLFGLLMALAVCVGMSLDTDSQRRERQRLAAERHDIRVERDRLAHERQQYADVLREWRELGSASPTVHRPDGQGTRHRAPPTPVA